MSCWIQFCRSQNGSNSTRFHVPHLATHPHQWQCRIGLSTGSVVGSVVGIQKYVYDIFGPAVNLASRLQEFSEPMQITVQDAVANVLKDQFDLQNVGEREVRGFKNQDVWVLSDNT